MLSLLFILSADVIRNHALLDQVIAPVFYNNRQVVLNNTSCFNCNSSFKGDELWAEYLPIERSHLEYGIKNEQAMNGVIVGTSHFLSNQKMFGFFADYHENRIDYDGYLLNQRMNTFGFFSNFNDGKWDLSGMIAVTSARSDDYKRQQVVFRTDTKVTKLYLEAARFFRTKFGSKVYLAPFLGLGVNYVSFGNLDIILGQEYFLTDLPFGFKLQYRSKNLDARLKAYMLPILTGESVSTYDMPGYSTDEYISTEIGKMFYGVSGSFKLRLTKFFAINGSFAIEKRGELTTTYLGAGFKIPLSL